jgi:hypothetical protein
LPVNTAFTMQEERLSSTSERAMIDHQDTVFLLSRVAAEADRKKKRAGLHLLALLRRDGSAAPALDRMVGCVARDLGGSAADHARGLLRTAGLA